MLSKLSGTSLYKLKEICVSEELSVSYDKWSEEYLLNSCVSEICVKRIGVNQGVGVY